MKINKLMSWLLACATVAGVTSCGSGSSDDYWKNFDAIPVQETSDGNWSFYKADGTLLYEDEFKSRPSAIYRGFFSVEEGEGYTVYRADKKPEVVGDLEGLKSAGFFYEEDLMPVVRPKERITIVNTKGETVFTLEPYKGKEIVRCDAAYSDGLLGVMTEDEMWGFVDTKGQMVIEPKYKWAAYFKNGHAAVAKTDDDSSTIIIDKKGEQLVKLRKGQAFENAYLTNDYLLVSDANDHLLILDLKGDTVFKCPSKVKKVADVRGDKLIFRTEDNEYGLMNFKGETLIRPKYSSMQFIESDKLLARLDENSLVLTTDGEETLRLEDYRDVSWMGKFGFVAKEKKSYSFLDAEGKAIKNADFEDIAVSTYLSYAINSDYFNTASVVNAVVGLIKDNGVGKYNYGAFPSQVFTNGSPRDYVWDMNSELSELSVSGLKYRINVTGYFTSQIAVYNYSYYSSSNYEWGDGTLYGFQINIYTETEWGNEGSEALYSAFSRDGYKTVSSTKKDSTSFAALLKKGDVRVMITSEKGGMNGTVVVYKYTDYTEDVERSQTAYIQSLNTASEDIPLDAVDASEEEVDSIY